MKKTTKCIAQTINLSKPKTCVRPRQVQKLVSGVVKEPCPTPGHGKTSYRVSRPVSIRICSRRDLERTCPPTVCDCPQKGPPETRLQKFGKLVQTLLKSAVAAGLVYWTSAEGVWGDSKDTENLYYRMMATVAPAISDMPDVDNIKLPQVGNFKYCIYNAYNRAVLGLMGILVGVPMTIQDKVSGILFPCDPLEELEDRSRKHRKADNAQAKKP
ncbi:uncharacterized protein LOC107262770 [Cephus cinctus]|uniref:MICOS complex subunit MIC13 n=1 Tax=Cephus cinctus TaxID=211228 RepID=A0AAJ7BFK8_CEPCN|nr:uncharacterized protein LOC107262770 [Cephus cinctus]